MSKPEFPTNPYLKERLEELPATVYKSLRRYLEESTDVTRVTIHKVLVGKSQNPTVVLAIAQYLKCDVKDVLNPDHVFEDPRRTELPNQAYLIQRFGLSPL